MLRNLPLYRITTTPEQSVIVYLGDRLGPYSLVTVQVTTGESRPHEATREVFGVASQIGSRFKCP